MSIIAINGRIGSGKDTVGSIIQYLIWKDKIEKSNDLHTYYSLNDFLNNPLGGHILSNWQIKKFADKLKDIVCFLINCKREDLEDQDFKNKELGEEWWYYTDSISTQPYIGVNLKMLDSYNIQLIKPTPRTFLQQIGTDLFRNQLHPNIWINSLFSSYKPTVYWMCDRCLDINIPRLIESKDKNGDIINVCPNCKGQEKEHDLTKVFDTEGSNWIITDCRFPNELQAVKDRGGISIRVNRNTENKDKHESETALDGAEFDYTINNNGTIDDLVEKVKEILIKEKIIC